MTGILGAAVLAGYAAALGIAVPPILRRAGWVLCAPGVAIGVWLALSVSWLTAVVLAGLVLARPLLARLEPAWLAHGAGMTSAGRGASAVLAATAGAGAVSNPAVNGSSGPDNRTRDLLCITSHLP